MKKIRLLALIPLLLLTGCNDTKTSCSGGKCTSDLHVHLQIGDVINHLDIKDYHANACSVVTLDLLDGTSITTGPNDIVIYRTDKCPLCNF